MITEKEIKAPNGIMFIFVLLTAQLSAIAMLINSMANANTLLIITSLLITIAIFVGWFGFFMVNPKEARVMQLFGKYAGTVHD